MSVPQGTPPGTPPGGPPRDAAASAGGPAGYDAPWATVAQWWRLTYGSQPYDEHLARSTYAQALEAWRRHADAAQAQWQAQTGTAAQWQAQTRAQPQWQAQTAAQTPDWQAQARPVSAAWPPAAPTPAYGYPPAQAGWGSAASRGAPPRPRRRGLLAALLIVFLVAGPLAAGAIGLVYWTSQGSLGGVGGARLNDGPAPVAGDSFKPTTDQFYYFLEAGTTIDGDLTARWNEDEVDVVIEGSSTSEDRRTVDQALADINRTVGDPQFTYSGDDPEIVIRFLGHDEFAKLPTTGGDTIGWCSTSYSARDYSLMHATISIDDSSEFRDSRASVISHELGHAIGLDDVRRSQWRQTIMYYRVSSPTSYTTADLAAIRMLYDPRLDSGATTSDIRAVWSPR